MRQVLGFGVVQDIEGADRVLIRMQKMKFEAPKPRDAVMTAAQADLFIKTALTQQRPSLAIGTALQFELGMRQIDCVGKWLPVDKDGAQSPWVIGRREWVDGLLWEHISPEQILQKTTTKTGTTITHNVALCPRTSRLLASVPLARRTGPVLIDERAGRPYAEFAYGKEWREIADLAGLPKELRNADARAGAATDATDNGVTDEDISQSLGHSDTKITQRYKRSKGLAQSERMARARFGVVAGDKV